ncbi:basic amino acid ABC transporter substrate-binding protein [Brachyspira hampsonii]|uniref:basic amino acid ABC transporter substrate-binding protein n=1 Tax=Brachyspira hampsonii TaxID=1287055 RepID=UPI000D352CBA|nr:basic amino acid ABC transporter substrate-binding protein [Brachyspira hampsonii]PTY40900.1 amino acid ABC transporter substrate-binding protein [Brachyspira hampsonii bv. II]
MKKILILLMLISSIIIISCGNSKTSEAENKPIYVGIDVDFPPFGYLNSDGQIGGFDYDIMSEIAKLSGLNVEFTHMQFSGLLPALQTKKIDAIIAAMTVTEERKLSVNFSEPYYVSSQVMLVHKDDDTIKTFDDLVGKNIGVVIGTTGDTIMTEKAGVNNEKFDTGAAAVLALKEKKISAVVFDKEPCKNFAKYNEDIKLIESDAVKEDYAIAVRKDDTALLEKINAGLSQIMTNGTYEKLIEKNFQ